MYCMYLGNKLVISSGYIIYGASQNKVPFVGYWYTEPCHLSPSVINNNVFCLVILTLEQLDMLIALGEGDKAYVTNTQWELYLDLYPLYIRT